MFYIIYQITNKINNKVYIGKHATTNLDDGYLGSGQYLKRAVKKYGTENFKKSILFVFDNETSMNEKEKELVNMEFVLRDDTYNLVMGGSGGQIVLMDGHPKFEETKKKIRNSKVGQRSWTNGVETVRRIKCPGPGWIIGRAPSLNYKWSEERKQKIKQDYNNGKMNWWNNGVSNIRNRDCPGEDWSRGRLKNNMSPMFNGKRKRKYTLATLKNIVTNEIFELTYDELLEFKKNNKNVVGQEMTARTRSHVKSIKYVIIKLI